MAIKTYTKGQKNQLSKNFVSTEFDCHGSGCCSSTKIDDKLIKYLQQIRDHFGKAVNINSGYRCKTHNASVGGASKSNHMDGEAADIRINGVTPIEVARYAEYIGMKGIGVYSWGVHVDTRTSKYFWYDGGASNVATFGKPSNIGSIDDEKEEKPSIDTSKVNTSAINDKTMWDYFKAKGLNDYGIAGLMGNLYAESGLRPANLQNSYEKHPDINMTDAEYTAAVDSGAYTNFVKDGAGYGLPQWTYWSLKQDFLNYVKNKGKSIGDAEIQMEFLAHQLSTDYKAVWNTLKNATSILEASNAVLLKFERPADQSTSAQNKRAQFGKVYYDKYATKQTTTTPTKPTTSNGYTNSPLVSYTKISPNKTSPRNHKIDTITIHCVVGQCSVETLGNVFAPTSRRASCNYGIGYDGKIGMYVEEKDRSWCSSNAANDNRAITIEVASDTTHPYAVRDAAYKALIDLLVDICERNDIKELKWKADKSLIGQVDKQNMTVHKWFDNKECPGKYLYDRHGEIAAAVNKRLGVSTETTKPEETPSESKPVVKELYRVRKSWEDVKSQIGAYSILENAKKACDLAGPNYKVFNSAGEQVHPEVEEFPYLVRINTAVLNVRAGAGTNYKVTTQVKRNQIYTIVDEKNGWGKLKSGAGWISLDYTERYHG